MASILAEFVFPRRELSWCTNDDCTRYLFVGILPRTTARLPHVASSIAVCQMPDPRPATSCPRTYDAQQKNTGRTARSTHRRDGNARLGRGTMAGHPSQIPGRRHGAKEVSLISQLGPQPKNNEGTNEQQCVLPKISTKTCDAKETPRRNRST